MKLVELLDTQRSGFKGKVVQLEEHITSTEPSSNLVKAATSSVLDCYALTDEKDLDLFNVLRGQAECGEMECLPIVLGSGLGDCNCVSVNGVKTIASLVLGCIESCNKSDHLHFTDRDIALRALVQETRIGSAAYFNDIQESVEHALDWPDNSSPSFKHKGIEKVYYGSRGRFWTIRNSVLIATPHQQDPTMAAAPTAEGGTGGNQTEVAELKQLEGKLSELQAMLQSIDLDEELGDEQSSLLIKETMLKKKGQEMQRLNLLKQKVEASAKEREKTRSDAEQRRRDMNEMKRRFHKRVEVKFQCILKKNEMMGNIVINWTDQTLRLEIAPRGCSETSRMQDFSLLSGGERTYTSFAFLISLGHLSAIPFQIMDEIDVNMDQQSQHMMHDQIVS